MAANLKPEEKDQYDARFHVFLSRMIEVAGYRPRLKYLYPIMEGVPFKDLEVSLDMARATYAAYTANDNLID